MSLCADCTRPAETSGWDHCLSMVPGTLPLCFECASRRMMVRAEKSLASMRLALKLGDTRSARGCAAEAGGWLVDAIDAAEGRVPA